MDNSQYPPVPANQPSASPAVPSVEEMQSQLAQAGTLLPGLQVSQKPEADTSPLAALQPNNMVDTPEGPRPMQLPSKNQPKLADTQLATTKVPTSTGAEMSRSLVGLKKAIKLIVAFALAGQALWGMLQSSLFVLVEYPQLEAKLVTHQISQTVVNQLGVNAMIQFGVSIISLVLALNILRSKSAGAINTAIGVVVFLGGTYLTQYLSQRIDVVGFLDNPVEIIRTSRQSVTDSVIDSSEYLEKNPDQTEPEVVWYQ